MFRRLNQHTEWVPHSYQEKAVDFLLDRGAAALFADPGLEDVNSLGGCSLVAE